MKDQGYVTAGPYTTADQVLAEYLTLEALEEADKIAKKRLIS